MKFLSKNVSSDILIQKITYRDSRDNSKLRDALLEEQRNFCAYTETFIQRLSSVEIEHFNSKKKGNDNYFNYYVVLRSANLYKKDEKFKILALHNESFFGSLFFQNRDVLDQRLGFQDGLYYVKKTNDQETEDFLDFLGLNHEKLFEDRSNHVKRLADTFQRAGYSNEEIKEYFRRNPQELSFVTAVEAYFKVNLEEIL